MVNAIKTERKDMNPPGLRSGAPLPRKGTHWYHRAIVLARTAAGWVSLFLQRMNDTSKKLSVLFVCIGNSCRSPMAESIALRDAADLFECASAGLSALGVVQKLTLQTLEA